jgi:hypothetical protein
MRAVVGSILLLLAVCLVSLGMYFWTLPRAQPTETPVIAAEVTTAQPADAATVQPTLQPTLQPSGSEAYPTPNASPPIPEAKARELSQLERAARQFPEDEVSFRKMAKLDEAARQFPEDEVSFRKLAKLHEAARQVPEDEVSFRKLAKLNEAARQVPEDEVSFRKLAKLDEAARQAAEEEQRRYEVIRRDLDALHRQTELDRRDADAKREPRTSAETDDHKISVSVTEQTWSEWVKSFREEIDAIKGIVVTLSGVATGLIGWLVLYSDRRKKKQATSIPS